METVGELDTVAVQLEAARGARIGGVEARQRRLGGRVAVHESESAMAKLRTHARAHEQFQQLIALRLAGRIVASARLEPECCRRLRELGEARGEGVERQLAHEGVAVAEPLGSALAACAP